VVYTVTPSVDSCSGSPVIYRIIINPLDDATFGYSSSTFCKENMVNPNPMITGVAGGVFSSTPSGLVFISPTTGQIDLSSSTVGSYIVRYTTSATCPNFKTVPITIKDAGANTNLSFHYEGPYCKNAAGNPVAILSSGAVAGVFRSSSSDLIFTNNQTGEINLVASTAGTYTVTNTVFCQGDSAMASNTITILASPEINNGFMSQTVCSGTASEALILTADVLGATFSWQATTVGVGITGYLSSGTGNIPSQTINNSSQQSGSVVYTIIPVAGGCSGTAKTYTIMVNPLDDATFTYPSSTFCKADTSVLLPTITGLAGGDFESPSSDPPFGKTRTSPARRFLQ